MKKTFALLLLSVVSFTAVSAQDKPAKGELIYGRVMGIDGPLAGIHVTEKNGYDRIMADGITERRVLIPSVQSGQQDRGITSRL